MNSVNRYMEPNRSWLYKAGEIIGMAVDALFSFLWRSALIVANLILLGGTITISAAHSLELMRYAGMSGGLEWVGMIVFELLFIFSSILLDKDFQRKDWKSDYWKTGWAPWTGFLMGLIFVGFSNYMGMAHNWVGRTIGLAMPVMLLVSKGLLMHQAKQRADDKLEKQRNMSSNEIIQQMMSRQDVVQPNTSSNESIQPMTSRHEIVQPNKSSAENIQLDKANENVQQDESNDVNVQQDVSNAGDAQLQEDSGDTIQPDTSSEDSIQTEEPGNNVQQNESSENLQQETSSENVQQDTSNEKLQQENSSENVQLDTNKKSNVVEFAKHSSNRSKKKRKNTDGEIQRAKELALQYEQENGELPGRPKLRELAGCSEYVAKEALKQLKESI